MTLSWRRALEAMLGSEVAWNAICAARACEDAERQLFYDFDCDDNPIDHGTTREEIDVAFIRYKHTLSRLKASFPDELNDCSAEGVCEHRRPCPCGRGMRGAWPWVVQTPARGFCEQSDAPPEQRGEWSCIELHEERERWLWAWSYACPTKRAEVMHDGKPRMTESRYREHMEWFVRELY